MTKCGKITNPFEVIETRLSNIENLILEVKNKLPDHANDQDKFLTIPQAAKLLHLSVPTMYGKTHRHEIPFMKRGKRVLFSKKQLIEYMEQGRKLTNDELKEKAHEFLKK